MFPNSRIKIHKNKLKILDFNYTKDSGTFICETYFKNGSLIGNDEINLKVNLHNYFFVQNNLPKVYLILENKNEIFVNSTIKINCELSENSEIYSVEWIRNGADIPKNSYVVQNSLIIEKVNKNDLGEYTCTVTNRIGQFNATIKLHSHNGIILHNLDDNNTETISNDLNLDERMQFLYGQYNLNLGDTLAIECLDICN